jgi:hypothetical protein
MSKITTLGEAQITPSDTLAIELARPTKPQQS